MCLRILPDCANERGCANAFGNQLPRCPVIACAVKIGLLIIQAVPINSRVSFSRIEVRRLDQRYSAPFAQPFWSHILPGCSAVSRDMDEAGVTSRPDQAS